MLAPDVEPRHYDVTCILAPTSNLYQLSYVVSGLWELAEDGLIDLRFDIADTRDEIGSMDCLAVMELRLGKTDWFYRIGLDVFDRRDVFGRNSLESCDLYFKRSYHLTEIRGLPVELRNKVLPFGCTYPCRSTRGESRLAAALGSEMARALDDYTDTVPTKLYEQGPEASVEPVVVFQTRVWAPSETSDDVDRLNHFRTQLLRSLRKAFPGRFRGGLVPYPYARRHYPDLLTTEAIDAPDYIQFSRRTLIAISTTGLHHSVPFKLAEYMAASRCIVSEPLRNTFPTPLTADDQYVEFTTPEGCIEQCDRILSDTAFANALRMSAWDYFQRELRPARHMANILECVVSKLDNSPGHPN